LSAFHRVSSASRSSSSCSKPWTMPTPQKSRKRLTWVTRTHTYSADKCREEQIDARIHRSMQHELSTLARARGGMYRFAEEARVGVVEH
jgi:hypothetical protein